MKRKAYSNNIVFSILNVSPMMIPDFFSLWSFFCSGVAFHVPDFDTQDTRITHSYYLYFYVYLFNISHSYFHSYSTSLPPSISPPFYVSFLANGVYSVLPSSRSFPYHILAVLQRCNLKYIFIYFLTFSSNPVINISAL